MAVPGREKIIVEDTLGNTMIPTQEGDTIFIHRRAVLNDQWEFYSDTTTKHYVATVTNIDTMTFAGIFDTVKTITITALTGSAVDASDTLNGLEMKLSKNYGWVHSIDLYLFPYKSAGSNSNSNYDCYLYQSLKIPFSFSYPSLSKKNLVFKKVAFHYLENKDINDWQIGDVFYSEDAWRTGLAGNSSIRHRDSIISKNETDTTYIYESTYISSHDPPTTPNGSGNRTLQYYKISFMYGDTTKMPEETGCRYYYYYSPNDSSFCYTSPKFSMLEDKIQNGRQIFYFEGGPYYTSAKEGLSTLNYGRNGLHPDSPTYFYDLWWANKNGYSCRAGNEIVGIKTPLLTEVFDVKIHPNPSAGLLYVDLPQSTNCTITIYNITGSIVSQKNLKGNRLEIDATDFPSGYYFLKYADQEHLIVKKIIINR